MKIATKTLLDYQLRKPLSSSKNPQLLFLLHGYGSHEQDLFSFAEYLPPEFLIVSLRAPIGLNYGGYAWYSIHFHETQDKWSDLEEAKQSQAILLHNIEYHKKQFGLSRQKVSLLGFSQGCILSWALGLANPKIVDRIIGLSGYVNPDFFDYSQEGVEQLRCFSSHGIQDPTIPINWARKGITQLKQNGVQVAYSEYESGHGISPENFQDLLSWFEKNP